MPVWDAIGAMARGRQVIVVGDPEQLPPTSIGQRGRGARTTTTTIQTPAKSSSTNASPATSQPDRLDWHYRSKHESLIAFSNARYYRGELVTFPSPVTKDTAVRFIQVARRRLRTRQGSR